MFSVASNFDDDLTGRLTGMEVDELFGSCDDASVGRGRPHAMIPPTKLEVPWSIDNRALHDVILPGGCHATGCEECSHCAAVAKRAVRARASQ